MREGGTYRAARRNFVRDLERDGKRPGIRVWKRLDFAEDANKAAKLDERAKQCFEARRTYIMVQGAPSMKVKALRKYWEQQKRTRVVSRILKELAA